MICELRRGDSVLASGLVRVHVVAKGKKVKPGWVRCAIGENLSFDTSRMMAYFFANRKLVLYDAFVVCAAIEFCDRIRRRRAQEWGRHFSLMIPVHDLDHWSQRSVSDPLRDALQFLTGDRWDLKFYSYEGQATSLYQGQFDLSRDISVVIPFSNGLDSCIAAALAGAKFGDRVVRVRLGTKNFLPSEINIQKEPFTAVPYTIRKGEMRYVESSVRSRGFKFALVGAIAAFLCGAKQVIIPESGQGALGPSLVPVGQIYPDYRSHPRFGRKMEKFLHALIGFDGWYVYPYIWKTKGEMLSRLIKKTPNDIHTRWVNTRTCWKPNTHTGVNGTARQCGICAACILRRMSVHASKQAEPASHYVWENLDVSKFESGVSSNFNKKMIFRSTKHDAIAGTLHMDHLARLSGSLACAPRLNMESYWLSQSLDICQSTAKQKLERFLGRHKYEWQQFMKSLGPSSFISRWVNEVQL